MFAYYLTVWYVTLFSRQHCYSRFLTCSSPRAARLSILLTVIRLSAGRFRRFLVWSGGLFALFFVFLVMQIWWNCERDGKVWANAEIMPQCPLKRDVVICQVFGAFIDILLSYSTLMI